MLASLILAFSLAAPPAAKEADRPTAAPFYAGDLKEMEGGALYVVPGPKAEKHRLVFLSRDTEAEAKKLVGKHLHIIGREGYANGETFVLVSLMREVARK